MKKYPIGFGGAKKEEERKQDTIRYTEEKVPRKSVVRVFFPHRGMGWSYYNDSFDLKVGDIVYVDGKLEGYKGHITEVNYSFKIKVSDYKKVIAVVDTNVSGDMYFSNCDILSFDREAIPYSKVISWFKAPCCDEEYEVGSDDSESFPLDNLSMMNISQGIAESGYEYYSDERVKYVELCNGKGRAIVEGSDTYEVEFNYNDGEISSLKCSCFCTGCCKHEFSVMLKLQDILKTAEENYKDEYFGYFACISKDVFFGMVLSKKESGKISFER